MNRSKKILLIIISILILLITSGIAITFIYEDEIKQYGITRINEQIESKIDVESIEFSVFRRFPSATLIFNNVTASEVNTSNKDGVLFKAEQVFVEFNIIELLKGQYNMTRIVSENGVLNMKIDKNGKRNFDIFKSSEEEKDELIVNLEEVLLKNIDVNFENEAKNIKLYQNVLNSSISGKFSNEIYEMKLDGLFHIQDHFINGNQFVHDKKVFIKVVFLVNSGKNFFEIQEGALSVQEMHFFINGDFTSGTEADLLNFTFSGNNLSISDVLSLIPDEYRKYMNVYDEEGEIKFVAKLRGTISNKLNPEFSVNFSIKNAWIKHLKSGVKLEDIQLSGSLTNGSTRGLITTRMDIDSVKAMLGSGSIEGKYTVLNFDDPVLTLHAITKGLKLGELNEFFPNDSLKELEGTMDLDLHLQGKIKDIGKFTIAEFRKSRTYGKAELKGFKFAHLGIQYTLDSTNAQLEFNNNDVKIYSMTGKMGRNDFEIDGNFKNLIPYIFDKNERLLMKANYKAERLFWDDFMTTKDSDNNTTFAPPNNIAFDLQTKINRFYYRKFTARNLIGRFRYGNNVFTIPNMSFSSMQGEVEGNLQIDATNPDRIRLKIDGNLIGVDISDLFTSFDQFGQDQITSENLRGKCTAQISFDSYWSSNWTIDQNSIEVNAKLKIENGELLDYKPVYSLAKFIELEELNKIKFSSLENDIKIIDKRIIIPDMAIKSSALNLNISGVHGFNNEIEYHFNLLLRDILSKKARKAKKENEEFGGHVEDDGLGRTTLYLKMTGTVADPKISYDRKGLREKWKSDLKDEKQTIKSILKEEFGKDDGSINKEEVQEYNFDIEWEEEDKQEKNEQEMSNEDEEKRNQKDGKKKKSWLDKISTPNENEYEEYNPDDL